MLAAMTVAVRRRCHRDLRAPLARKDFSQFPMTMDKWQGKPDRMEAIYVDVLKLDDYILANFTAPSNQPGEFLCRILRLAAKGRIGPLSPLLHSRRGVGNNGLTQHNVEVQRSQDETLRVNRALIQKGDRGNSYTTGSSNGVA